jgi:hypothetical protein
MAKRQIDFTGPSVQDLGIETNKGTSKKGNSNITNTKKLSKENNLTESEFTKMKEENAPANIGIANKGNTTISNTEKGNSNIPNTKIVREKSNVVKPKPAKSETEKPAINIGIAANSNTDISNTINGYTKKTYNTVQFKLIRDYLYAALGENDRTEIKLSVMGQELGINPKTLYKHLKTLRNTEFSITKLQYATEIRKRP